MTGCGGQSRRRLMPGSLRVAAGITLVIAVVAMTCPAPAIAVSRLMMQAGCLGQTCPEIKSTPGYGTEPEETVRPHPWKFKRQIGARTVVIRVGWVSCTHKAPIIRLEIERHRGRAIITAIERSLAVPPVTGCLKSRGYTELKVQLPVDVSRLRLFDGSYSPPKLRWRGSQAH
jgi:hypothetical protein